MKFHELFKAELKVRGIVGQRANRLMAQYYAGCLGVPLNADWDENEHPRAKDGKFTNGNGQPKDLIGDGGETVTQIAKREVTEARKAWSDFHKKNPNPVNAGELREDQRLWGNYQTAKERLEKVKTTVPQADRREKMMKMAKEYVSIQDEMDAIEEKYGDNAIGGPLKFTKDDRGKLDSHNYRKMKRRAEILSKRIDWNDVDDDEINEYRKNPDAVKKDNALPLKKGPETDSDFAYMYPDFDENGKESLDEYIKRGGKVRKWVDDPYERSRIEHQDYDPDDDD